MDEIVDITLFVARVFDQLDVAYVVGGSLASSFHGIPRATQDVDIIAEMTEAHVPGFVAALRDTFYLDEGAIRDAIARRRSFNVVHLGSYFKADIFISKDDASSRLEMERRQSVSLGGVPPRTLYVASAEDVVAQKLVWYQLGDEVSDRQWSDALGVLKVSGTDLDFEYLEHVCGLLGVRDLLHRLRKEAAGGGQ